MKFFEYALPQSVGLDAGLIAALDRVGEKHVDNKMVGGEAITVVCRDKIVYENHFGYADPEKEIPIGENHLYRMASMAKPVTAVCILMLWEEGKLSLDDPLEKYLPMFRDMQVAELDEAGNLLGTHPSPRSITIRDLLTHSSGIHSGDFLDKLQCNGACPAGCVLGDKMNDWAASLLAFDPGTIAAYSWLVAFDILAHLVEVLSGMTFADFTEKRLFSPLGMKDTTFAPTEEHWSRAVRMCQPNTETNTVGILDYLDKATLLGVASTYHSGAAGLVSSLTDYSRFAHMLCHGGISGGVRILQESTVREMCTKQLPDNIMGTDETINWGLGVRLILQDNCTETTLPKGTFYWPGAYGTYFWCDPAREMVVVYCTNVLGVDSEILQGDVRSAVLEHLGALNEIKESY